MASPKVLWMERWLRGEMGRGLEVGGGVGCLSLPSPCSTYPLYKVFSRYQEPLVLRRPWALQEISRVGEGKMGPNLSSLPPELDWKEGLELRSLFRAHTLVAPKPPDHSWVFWKSVGVDANWVELTLPSTSCGALTEFPRFLILDILIICTLEILIVLTYLTLLCFTDTVFFYKVKTDPSTSKNITIYFIIFYCIGLEPNSQYLRGMPVPTNGRINEPISVST